MRTPSDMPRPRRTPREPSSTPGRGRTILVIAAIALFILITSLRGIAGFYTDFLWFDSLGYDGVWSGVLGAKLALAAIFIAAFFAVCLANLVIADRLAPRFPPPGPEQEVFDRFREVIGHRTALLRVGIAGLLAIVAGAGQSQEWRKWLLFVNGDDWGMADAQFNRDIGFFVFKLPFLTAVTDWAFASTIIIIIVTIAAHFANGGIRVQPTGPSPGPRVTSQVKAHISVLLGLLALIRAFGYYLDRFELSTSSRGFVDGPGYADVNAQLPALNLLLLISVASFVLFIVNIWRRGWVLPALGVGLWGLVSVIAVGIYPAVIQRLQVTPNELSKEAPYIDRNIEATREAMGLSAVSEVRFPLNEQESGIDLRDDEDTVKNIRLWDPSPNMTGQTFSELQQLLPYYALNDVDVDRYLIDGELTQVVLAARDLDRANLPISSWEAEHVTYTHGYGIVLANGTSKTRTGRPDFKLADVPVSEKTDLDLVEPRLYFGEDTGGFIITGTDSPELDFQDGDVTEFVNYAGEDGVGVGSLLRRVAFALRFGDFNPLITDLIDGDSKIHYIRAVGDRVRMLAPFLEFDADPYPIITDEGTFWMVDAYTTTNRFPYGQTADTRQVNQSSGLRKNFNYVRNSVKAVVDAYDGTVSFYVTDPEDPIINAWRSAFPELFTDFDDMPDELRDHIRYPEDLFRVQTNMWSRYHVDEAETFFTNNDAWNVARDPGTTGAVGETTFDAQGNAIDSQSARIAPYYLLMRLPDEDDVEFVILRQFVPFGTDDRNQQMTAFMVARSDPERYGELITYLMPTNNRPEGPAIIADAIQSDPVVSEQQTLLGGSGSAVKFGNLILVPVDESLVYVRPFYVESDQQKIPELKKVIAVFQGEEGSKVSVADTLEEALRGLFGNRVPSLEEVVSDSGEVLDDPDTDTDTDTDTTTGDDGELLTENERLSRLLTRAENLFREADEALADGDLGEYQRLIEQGSRLVEQAREILAPATTTTTTTTEPPQEEA